MRELFRQVSDPHAVVGSTRLSALPASIVVHVLVLLAVIVIPLLATDVLPAVRASDVEWTPVVMPPSPPPVAVPAAHRVAAPVPDANLAPVVVPTGIAPQRLLASDQPDVAAPTISGEVPGIDAASIPNSGVITDVAPVVRPPAPVRVHTLLRPPVKVHDVSPSYPDAARLARVEGMVIIEAVIGTSGEVTDARVLRSRPLLDQAALDAVKQWRYTPSLLNGIPVPVIMTVTVNFTLK